MKTVYTNTYAPPPVNKSEILRYAGIRGKAPEFDNLLNDCLTEAEGQLIYKICWREFDIERSGELLDLGFTKISSAGLKKNLSECSSLVLFAATVGLGIDRLIARYSSVEPTRALMFQAIGAERVESLCDLFNKELSEKYAALGFVTRSRFSAGYGDFPLAAQREIFTALDCPRKIGLTLNESLLMSPSKSVTAIIGISKAEE